ncbi:hypothetical protein PHYPSEUDO_005568 [Phytophthora pseudosyringae]|uniref:Tubby C-terminal domain-containing protein n=1 Tax=Phytophthora pseudosyringae TaxID=221518 RepID=A0A8T1WC29_9STRA|nr:hypothetical protein PHYPSEUDO_005568 [Phytophthora pseudosyringae]
MGNSNSADLGTVLQSPSGPMRALDASWIAPAPTCVHVKAALAGTSAAVTNAATNTEVYTFKAKVFSSRTFLKGPEGQILVTVKKNAFSSKFHVFPGDQTEHEQFMIRDASGIFNTMLLVADYFDHKTGCPCRVVAKGSPSKRVVVCYLERGSPRLSQLQNSEDFLTNVGCYQPIGRFNREKKFIGRDEYEVEAPAGVDVTLLLLIWHVRQVLLDAERSSNA